MKRLLFFLLAFSLGSSLDQISWAAQNPNPPEFGMQIGFFYSSLRPHGEWIELESGFHVWRPLHTQHQWRPYLMGQWVWTDDYGWYWMSSEPFGWITYHYGRWYNDDYYGWVWMPDDVWGPAWVEWRYDDDYVGWAPLPPYASFSLNFGIRFSTPWVAPAHYWNFVHYNRFGSVIRYRDIASIEHTRRLIGTTRSDYRYDTNHDRVINRGVDRTIIERRGNVRISSAKVREVRDQSGERAIRTSGSRRMERIDIYRPTRDEMQRNTGHIEAKRGERALSIDMNKIERSHREPSQERTKVEQLRTSQQQSDRTIQRETQQQESQHNVQRQEQQRSNKPRVQEHKSQQNRREMRRELIQRYERKQNLSSPATHEAQQQRMERQKGNLQREHSVRTPSERRSSRGSEKRRGE
jgi:hypothetical protein